jgi:hypothetical protein
MVDFAQGVEEIFSSKVENGGSFFFTQGIRTLDGELRKN